MSAKQYPPCHHRDAEHLREELEAIHNLLRVCVDSMQLVNALELVHTTNVLDSLSERTWEAIAPAKALETVLYEEWLTKIEAKKAPSHFTDGNIRVMKQLFSSFCIESPISFIQPPIVMSNPPCSSRFQLPKKVVLPGKRQIFLTS